MKAKALVALMLGSTISLSAQMTATLNQLSDGSEEIKLRNDSAVSLTTFAISVDYVNKISPTPSRLIVYIDPVIDRLLPANRNVMPIARGPLLPQEEITMSPEVMVAISALTGKPTFSRLITAGIFADGSTAGDSGLLTGLMLRRSNLLLAVETTLKTLSDGDRRNLPRNLLIDQLREKADSLNYWYVLAEQRVGQKIYQSVIEKLMNSPGVSYDSFSTNAFVAQETAQLLRQRATLLQAQPGLATPIAR